MIIIFEVWSLGSPPEDCVPEGRGTRAKKELVTACLPEGYPRTIISMINLYLNTGYGCRL